MNKRSHLFSTLTLLLCAILIGFTSVSCSSSKSTTRKKPSYAKGRDMRPRWNTTTSTHQTYYIKKRKPHKRYNR
ncbi:MAG: hypothetical protein K6F40_03675 [Bacteroidales bacterium]|nr:hypothetical protein [Bacteroidales bacterium]